MDHPRTSQDRPHCLSLGTPLFIGAEMKIAYDIMLYRSFRGIEPPEERQG